MKERTLCVWFPMWSLTRPDAPPGKPLLVVDDRVTGATPDVLDAGVALGMPRREAEALAPFATVLVRDVGEEARRFEKVVAVIEDLIPRVEVVEPGLVFVPISGAIKFYGGEDLLANKVAEAVVGFDRALLGIADGPFAARWAAARASFDKPLLVEDTRAFLSSLDLESLREGVASDSLIATFRWLGVSTLGDITGFPRDALATRFGNEGVLAHRLASGEDRSAEPREIRPDLAVEMEFEDPLETIDAVAFAARNISERMLRRLRKVGVAPHQVSILAEPALGKVRERIWRSADPLTERALSDRVWWQLRAWMENGGVPGGIIRIRIAPSDLSGEGRQLGVFGNEAAMIEAERAFARTQALLGPDDVLQAQPQGGRMPAQRVSWSRWNESTLKPERDPDAPWPGSTPKPSPALVPPRLQPLQVEWDDGMPSRVRLGTRWEPVLTWSGPWRLSGRWWAGERDADRYQLVTSACALLCVVADGKSYLAGVYD
jgi:protein ImuB